MSFQLSEGALELIMTGGHYESPIMQILGSKKLASGNQAERYRLLISDGKHHNSFAMIATQLNHLVSNGELTEFTVVRINRYISSLINNSADVERRVMVILELEILKKGNEVGVRIGSPTNLEGFTSNNAAPAPRAPSPQQPKPSSVGPKSTPAASSFNNLVKMSPGPSSTIYPISSLNPYQNKWCIKARLTSKPPIKTYTNARGEGKLFNVTFTDESGEIRCTGFNSVVDKLSPLLELNKVYLVSNCHIKPANKKFSAADYEMTFNDESFVQLCEDNDSSLPTQKFNFTPINKLNDLAPDSIVDVIGVAKQAGDVLTFVARTTQKELKKRDVTLVDQSNVSVALTLWGSQAEEYDATRQPVIAIKGGKVNDFMGGRSLSVLMSSTLQFDPDIEEAHKLRGWFDNGGASGEIQSISAKTGGQGSSGNWIHLGEITSQGIGLGDKADYFSDVVNVLMVRSENCVYKACPGQDCKKKIMDMNNGQYRCEKCNRDYDHFIYRMLLSAQVGDFTGSTWVTMFNEEAQKLLGADAQTIGEAIDNRDESYKEYFTSLNFKKFQMKFRTKMESYNDEKRLKTTVVSLEPVDNKTYARRLLDQFKTSAGVVTTQ